MPEYLVRLAQVHESFRKAELQALAELAGVEIEFVSYNEDVGIFSVNLVFGVKFTSRKLYLFPA
jgi:tRNA G10  N-methylase Trm11